MPFLHRRTRREERQSSCERIQRLFRRHQRKQRALRSKQIAWEVRRESLIALLQSITGSELEAQQCRLICIHVTNSRTLRRFMAVSGCRLSEVLRQSAVNQQSVRALLQIVDPRLGKKTDEVYRSPAACRSVPAGARRAGNCGTSGRCGCAAIRLASQPKQTTARTAAGPRAEWRRKCYLEGRE